MSNLKIDCVHCNGTGFCENYIYLYRTEIKNRGGYGGYLLEFIFYFSYYCIKCGKNVEIMDSLIKIIEYNSSLHTSFFLSSDKFINMSRSALENYLSINESKSYKIHTRFDFIEKPQKLICYSCLGKGYNII